MTQANRFGWITVEFRVPDIRHGIDYYSRLLGRPPNFEPCEDFKEWDFEGFTIQLAEGEARPTHPVRLQVLDIEAEWERVNTELSAASSPVKRIPGLVAFFNFCDPWGNNLGFYQTLFDGVPRAPGGSWRAGNEPRVEVRGSSAESLQH